MNYVETESSLTLRIRWIGLQQIGIDVITVVPDEDFHFLAIIENRELDGLGLVVAVRVPYDVRQSFVDSDLHIPDIFFGNAALR